MVAVMQYLDIDAIACAGVASQQWCALCRCNALWEALYKREFPLRMHSKLVKRYQDWGHGNGPKSWFQEYYETPRAKFRGFYFCRQWCVVFLP